MTRKTWKDVMNSVTGREKTQSSSGHTYRSGHSGVQGNWFKKDIMKHHMLESLSQYSHEFHAENQKNQSTTQATLFDLNELLDEEEQPMS